jgi:flagellar protein FlaG
MINDVVKNGYSSPTPVREVASASSPFTARSTAATNTETVQETPVPATTQAQPNPAQLKEAVSKLNDYTQSISRKLSFSIEESTGRTVIKVYDAETDELIRQIPPEETLRLAEVIGDQGSSNLFIHERT